MGKRGSVQNLFAVLFRLMGSHQGVDILFSTIDRMTFCSGVLGLELRRSLLDYEVEQLEALLTLLCVEGDGMGETTYYGRKGVFNVSTSFQELRVQRMGGLGGVFGQ